MKFRASRILSRRNLVYGGLLAIILLVLGTSLSSAHVLHTYNTDNTSTQTISHYWKAGLHTKAIFAADNFLFRFPFYFVFDGWLPPNRTTLLFEAFLFNAISFSLLMISVRYFVTKAVGRFRLVHWLPLIWLSSLGAGFFAFQADPNNRNLEFGVAFGLLMLFDRLIEKPKLSLWQTGLLGALAGFLFFEDPYFLYNLAAPIGLLLGIQIFKEGRLRRRTFRAITVLLVSGGFYVFWTKLFALAGIAAGNTVPDWFRFISFDQIPSRLKLFAQALLVYLNADFFGYKIVSLESVMRLFNFGLAAVAVNLIWRNFRSNASRPNGWTRLLAGVGIFVGLIFLLSGDNVIFNLSEGRYLTLAMYIFAFMLPLVLKKNRYGYLLAVVLIVATVLNVHNNLTRVAKFKSVPHNSIHVQVTNFIKSQGLTKGYSDIHNSHINSFFADYQTHFIQTTCASGDLVIDRWLMEEAVLTIPAAKTFFLFDNESSEPCLKSAIETKFGPAQSVDQINERMTLYVYDYDIGSKLR